jgi:site-specific recombinase XerD
MFDVIKGFKNYLEDQQRLPEDEVVKYLGYLPIIMDHLNVSSTLEITPEKVQKACRRRRWEITENGIQVNEHSEKGYLKAMKDLLVYLEKQQALPVNGLASYVHMPESRQRNLRRLTKTESAKLREFLVFNVATSTQRRETALVLLLWTTGCSLTEILKLNVHESGIVQPEEVAGRSGNFFWENDECWMQFLDESGETRTVKVLPEALHFVNFYLENRNQRDRRLFLSDVKRKGFTRLSERAAQTIVHRVLQKAGIPCEKPYAVQLLRISPFAISQQPDTNQWQHSPEQTNNSEKTARQYLFHEKVA